MITRETMYKAVNKLEKDYREEIIPLMEECRSAIRKVFSSVDLNWMNIVATRNSATLKSDHHITEIPGGFEITNYFGYNIQTDEWKHSYSNSVFHNFLIYAKNINPLGLCLGMNWVSCGQGTSLMDNVLRDPVLSKDDNRLYEFLITSANNMNAVKAGVKPFFKVFIPELMRSVASIHNWCVDKDNANEKEFTSLFGQLDEPKHKIRFVCEIRCEKI